jgi:Family of unknown function (DUF5670)
MLFTSALIVLVTWLVGVLFFRSVGDPVHVPLLVGLALLMLAFLRAREEAMRRVTESQPDKK